MTSSPRERALDAALELLRSGQPVSLDTVARTVGITKAGLMHHFPTKSALMLALVDQVAERWVSGLHRHLGADPAGTGPEARATAYLHWCLAAEPDASDLVMLADPRLRAPLTQRWAELLEPWFAVPAGLSADARGRLAAVRLLADGVWFARSIDFLPPAVDEQAAVRAAADRILEGRP